MAVEAGSGALSDEDRSSIASELEQIENQLYALMNSKDANGQYLFAGSSSGTQPYVKNPDGTYSYQGNQNSLSLQVSGSMLLSVNDSGWSVFENVVNAGRTTSALATNPNADGEQRVFLPPGWSSTTRPTISNFARDRLIRWNWSAARNSSSATRTAPMSPPR